MGQGLFTIITSFQGISVRPKATGTMATTQKTTKIDSLLADLFRKKQWDKRLGLHAVFEKWPEIVGGEIAWRAQPHLIRGTVLWVTVSDSVWMQQLHLQKVQLLANINRSLPGDEKISDLRFQLDARLDRERQEEEKAPEPQPPKPIDPEEKRAFERLLSGIPEEETRKRLLSLWIKSHQRPEPEKK